MQRQHGWNSWIEFFGFSGQELLDAPKHHGFDIKHRGARQVVFGQKTVARHPRHGQNLHQPRFRFDQINTRAVGNDHTFDGQRVKDFDGMRPAYGGRNIMVANQNVHRQPGAPQAVNTAGELALVGWVGRSIFINVASDQHQIDVLIQTKGNRLIEPFEVIV